MKKITTKKKQHQMKKSNPKSEPQDVHIMTFFKDGEKNYKKIILFTNIENIYNAIEINQKALKRDPNFLNKTYNDAINFAFRPKVSFDNISRVILNYICCHFTAEYVTQQVSQWPCKPLIIFAYIHLEYEDGSYAAMGPLLDKQISKPMFTLHEKSNLALSHPSKLEFLTKIELLFLNKLVQLIIDSGKSRLKCDYGLLVNLLSDKEVDIDLSDNDTVYSILNTLGFYNLISYENTYIKNGSKFYYQNPKYDFTISVNELELFKKYYQLMESNRAA